MALFERTSHAHLPALLRQGFAARLRSETADIYLAQTDDTPTITKRRAQAAVFFFLTGNGPLTAILTRPSNRADPKFLSLSDKPALTDTHTLLKLNLANRDRMLFSVSSVTPSAHLSLHRVAPGARVTLRPVCTKWELFHLEILPSTIGKGLSPSPSRDVPFMTVPQAVSHAVLELGARLRFRSTHERVLRVDGDRVRQDGPKTSLASSDDAELLVTAFRRSEDVPHPSCASYTLKHVTSNKALRVTPAGAELVDSDAATLIRASPNGWGAVSLGVAEKDTTSWLMAGARGRLETRKQPGAWETFAIEVVRQSYDAALREVPVPAIYKVAEIATRAAVRKQIEARVAEAKGVSGAGRGSKDARGGTKEPSTEDKKKFDHAKALSGLSDPPAKNSTAEKATTSQANLDSRGNKQPRKARRKAGAKGPAIPPAAAAESGLPRNKANRKASKKSKKKQKAKSAGKAAPKSKPPARPETTAKPSTNAADPSKSETESKSDAGPSGEAKSDVASSSSESAGPGSGPPCSACGRPMAGTYTKALGKNFHPQCFCCGWCRRPMVVGAGQFRERGGTPYCKSCYATHLASRCAKCAQPILETVITAMEKTWHKACLICTTCALPLTQTFWLYADKPSEPRCSRCVTGDENYTSGRGSRRMVNLPMFGKSNNTPSFPMTGPTNTSGAIGGAGQGGRARLMSPILPPSTRR